ncbi:Aldo/keto reductase [Panaeolus papilionaceus]|nr:Aldo/keto reductase [Panaeolus papilionaceus]
MPASKSVKLNTGASMPTLGLGTWQSGPGEVARAVTVALQAGYRHIDTATAYENEAEVGQGIIDSGVPREEIFLTTKLNNNDHQKVEEALFYSLKQLKTSYIDLWLMHWPAPMTQKLDGPERQLDWLDTWKAMEKVYKAHPDKVKAIGVSNFSINFLNRLLQNSEVTPAANQIELHPFCTQADLVALCRSKGIVVTAYSPLGSTKATVREDPVVKKIAEKHGVSAANVLLSFHANQEGVSVLGKSVTPERIITNFKFIDLSDEEVRELKALDNDQNHFRVCHPNWTGWGSLGFEDCEK